MNDRVFVKPGEGLKYRDEYTLAHIPESGAFVKRTRYVERRLMAGDIVEAVPVAEVAESVQEPVSEETRKPRRRAESEG